MERKYITDKFLRLVYTTGLVDYNQIGLTNLNWLKTNARSVDRSKLDLLVKQYCLTKERIDAVVTDMLAQKGLIPFLNSNTVAPFYPEVDDCVERLFSDLCTYVGSQYKTAIGKVRKSFLSAVEEEFKDKDLKEQYLHTACVKQMLEPISLTYERHTLMSGIAADYHGAIVKGALEKSYQELWLYKELVTVNAIFTDSPKGHWIYAAYELVEALKNAEKNDHAKAMEQLAAAFGEKPMQLVKRLTPMSRAEQKAFLERLLAPRGLDLSLSNVQHQQLSLFF